MSRVTIALLILLTLVLGIPAACFWRMATPVPQPPSLRTVEALQVPAATPEEKAELVRILRRHAGPEALEVFDASREEAELTHGRITIWVSITRTTGDVEEPEVEVGNMDAPAEACVTFSRGRRPDRAAAFRQALIADLKARWPTSTVVYPNRFGSLPLPDGCGPWENMPAQDRPTAQDRPPAASPPTSPASPTSSRP